MKIVWEPLVGLTPIGFSFERARHNHNRNSNKLFFYTSLNYQTVDSNILEPITFIKKEKNIRIILKNEYLSNHNLIFLDKSF